MVGITTPFKEAKSDLVVRVKTVCMIMIVDLYFALNFKSFCVQNKASSETMSKNNR